MTTEKFLHTVHDWSFDTAQEAWDKIDTLEPLDDPTDYPRPVFFDTLKKYGVMLNSAAAFLGL